ncbi:MAG: glutamyl-tRNA reductase [Phycisphaerae bacterium]|nr:glutamyl-tRNA reductase [Phycisphaerae bacterium]
MLYCIGIDHRTPIEAREALALTASQGAALLEGLREERLFSEALVLSTCNRTEFYLVAGEAAMDRGVARLLARLATVKGVAAVDGAGLYRLAGVEAVSHLFRVASSLESQVVGEHEILGQVKSAYRQACQAGTAGFLLHKLLHAAFRVGKGVMTRTRLGQGTASVSQAAVELARRIFSSLHGRTVLLIGAGATAELAVRAAARAGMNHLIVANRTEARAAALIEHFQQWRREEFPDDSPAQASTDQRRFACPALAALLGAQCDEGVSPASRETPPLSARTISLADVPAALAEADLVIAASGSPQPLLTPANAGDALRVLRKPLLVLDVAMPRDIDPALGKLPYVCLVDIDALQTIVEQNLRQRQAEIPKADAIVEAETASFMEWLASRDAVPTIRLLRERLTALAAAEVDRHARHWPAPQREAMEELARSICNKLAHDPVTFLGQLGAASNGDAMATIDLVRQLFRLDEPRTEVTSH